MSIQSTAQNAIVNMSDPKYQEELRSYLRKFSELSNSAFSADTGVARHDDPPHKISLPKGMSVATAATQLNDAAIEEAQSQVFNRTFKFRPWDGANAVTQVMRTFFGTTGRGVAIQGFFGSTPPQQIDIQVGPEDNDTITVPWGHINFEPFEGMLMMGATRDKEYGQLFQLSIECPKKYAMEVSGFFYLIDAYLKENSIYKGKALYGTDQPKFLRIKNNPTIVYNDDVNAALQNCIWGVVENADLFREDHRRVNKRTLLWGPYGTGKSEALTKTAQVAVANGWTYFQFNSGQGTLDDLEAAIATARLYQPAVVAIEDIDTYASNEGENYQVRLSNLFDGVNSKGDEVMLVMTSNKPANFSKGMLRAGRVDRMIEIGALDRAATEEMIQRVIGKHRLGTPVNNTISLSDYEAEVSAEQETTVDYQRVWAAMADFEPAFVRQTFDQAAEAAIIRTHSLSYVLTTVDFERAAKLLKPQHDLHAAKSDEKKDVTLDTKMRHLVKDVFEEMKGEMGGEEITFSRAGIDA